MTTSAFSGPVVAFGSTGSPESNPDRGPSMWDQGDALMDPRIPYAADSPRYGWLGTTEIPVISQVPSALAANNIVTAQLAVTTVALTLTAGTGVTGATSITTSTGATVTGLLALDGAAGVVTLGLARIYDPTKAISRAVRIVSAGGDDTLCVFTVRGYDIYGVAMTEAITGANAGTATGKKAFKYIASVTPVGTVGSTTVTVGTTDIFGIPLRSDYFGEVSINYNSAWITANTGYVAAVTTSPATTTTGDVRGTYNVQSASDAAKRLMIFASPSLANISSATGLTGVTQV